RRRGVVWEEGPALWAPPPTPLLTTTTNNQPVILSAEGAKDLLFRHCELRRRREGPAFPKGGDHFFPVRLEHPRSRSRCPSTSPPPCSPPTPRAPASTSTWWSISTLPCGAPRCRAQGSAPSPHWWPTCTTAG